MKILESPEPPATAEWVQRTRRVGRAIQTPSRQSAAWRGFFRLRIADGAKARLAYDNEIV